MKYEGQSWNYNHKKAKKGVKTQYSCSKCGRKYKQEYTKNNHEKVCYYDNE